ncbi:phage infection protein [Lacticaseibacillus jixianensis]|uniref:Phage infection protein n=1 Tax=Lacticaseibacillus jixianensis TaxID=2486012 RepID=A0ABW4B7N7_9LACO|nr:phage infection protein [Lacticaseibacillus jixianensis]
MTYADQIGAAAFQRLTADFFDHRYQDRGMKKWQGYFLSDHTAALKKQAAAEALLQDQTALPQQSEAEIRRVLAAAFASGQSVIVQLRHLTPEGRLAAPLGGKVAGYTDWDEVGIAGVQVSIADIRHSELVPFPRR